MSGLETKSFKSFQNEVRYFLTFFVIGVIYVTLLFILPPDGFWVVDNGNKFLTVENITRSHFKSITIDYPGKRIDPELRFVPLRPPFAVVQGEKLYSVFPPFFPFLEALLFKLFGFRGLYLLPLLAGWGTLFLSKKLFQRTMGKKYTHLFLVILGLGTPILFYSLVLWEHTPALFLSMGALILVSSSLSVEAPKQGGARFVRFIGAGLLLGAAFWMRFEAGIMLAAISLALIFELNKRDVFHPLLGLGLGFLISAGILGYLNARITGAVIPFQLKENFRLAGGLGLASRLENFLVLLFQPHRNSWYSLLIILPLAGLILLWKLSGKSGSKFMNWSARINVVIFSAVVLVFWLLAFRAEDPIFNLFYNNSLLFTTPILIFAFLHRPRAENVRFLWDVSFLFILLVCLTTPISRGVHWGPRLLLLIYPPLVLLSFNILRDEVEGEGCPQFMKRIFLFLALITIGIQTGGLWLLKVRKEGMKEITVRLGGERTGPIVTDGWFLAQDMALIFNQKSFFYVKNEAGLADLILDMRNAGEEEVTLIFARHRGRVMDGVVEVLPHLRKRKHCPFPHLFPTLRIAWLKLEIAELSEYFNVRGVSLSFKGDLGAGLKLLKAAITLAPDRAAFHYNLGITYGKLGRIDAAMKEIEKAVELEPNNPIYNNFWERLKEQGAP